MGPVKRESFLVEMKHKWVCKVNEGDKKINVESLSVIQPTHEEEEEGSKETEGTSNMEMALAFENKSWLSRNQTKVIGIENRRHDCSK